MISLSLAGILLAGSWVGYAWHDFTVPKFQNVTIELGQTELNARQFLTAYGQAGQAQFVTDLNTIDFSKVGEQEITLRQGWKEETVKLIIQDTVAPTAQFQDVVISVDDTVEPEDFVVEAFDLSGTEVSLAETYAAPRTYEDRTVEVVVSDPFGNEITGECTISYIWLRDAVTLEYGQELTKADLLLDPQKDARLLSQAAINAINRSPVGVYTLTGVSGGETLSCTVTVQDTQSPVLTLREVTIYPGDTVTLEDFVEEASDPSGVTALELLTDVDVNTLGSQTVTIRATDPYGHETVAQTTLWVTQDPYGPEFSGLTTMEIAVGSSPDYADHVSASDNLDGGVSFTYDASGVDTSQMGSYYVTYTARDSSGNLTTERRRVEVNHTEEDVAALVAQMAAACGDDPISIKLYVQEYVDYNSNWGGGDPVWYGLTHNIGNCLVHARVLQEVMKLKGYTTQLIWVTNRTHYWLIVDMGGYWRHIDATPGPAHGWTRLMTDQERLDALSGRDWDHSLWPPCV